MYSKSVRLGPCRHLPKRPTGHRTHWYSYLSSNQHECMKSLDCFCLENVSDILLLFHERQVLKVSLFQLPNEICNEMQTEIYTTDECECRVNYRRVQKSISNRVPVLIGLKSSGMRHLKCRINHPIVPSYLCAGRRVEIASIFRHVWDQWHDATNDFAV